MDQDDEAVLGEGLRERLQTVLLDPGVAVGHGDRRMRARTVRQEEPATQLYRAVGLELDIFALNHGTTF